MNNERYNIFVVMYNNNQYICSHTTIDIHKMLKNRNYTYKSIKYENIYDY